MPKCQTRCSVTVAYPYKLFRPEMSDAGLTVPGMNEPPSRYDVTVTVARDGGYLPDPAEFAGAAEQAASSRAASVVSAHGPADHQRGHRGDGGPVRSRGRRPGGRVRRAQASGRVAQPLSGRLWPTWCGDS